MHSSFAAMTSVSLPVADYTVQVTVGSKTASFVFRVRRQPASSRSFARLTQTGERYTLTFIVQDATTYDTQAGTDPRAVFTTDFTTALISALRLLITGGGSMIPAPGSNVNFGGLTPSVVDSVEIAQTSDGVTDVFIVTCNIEEDTAGSISIGGEDVPKMAKSDELPPWQLPVDVSFEAQTTEGLTLGFAYPTSDLDGTQQYSNEALRKKGLAAASTLVPVENYAKDPFSSPPAMPRTNGSLKVSKSYLQGGGTVDLSALQGTVNDGAIMISVVGSKFFFPEGTISPTFFHIAPKTWKKPLPWLPKTKHPLNKTYGELFYGYSKTAANKVAINKTQQTIIVYQPLRYIEVSATFDFRPEGFGVWVANRGYMAKSKANNGKLEPITDDASGNMKEGWLDKNGCEAEGEERIWRGFTNRVPSAKPKELLEAFFRTAGNDFSWATSKDNFGEQVL